MEELDFYTHDRFEVLEADFLDEFDYQAEQIEDEEYL